MGAVAAVTRPTDVEIAAARALLDEHLAGPYALEVSAEWYILTAVRDELTAPRYDAGTRVRLALAWIQAYEDWST